MSPSAKQLLRISAGLLLAAVWIAAATAIISLSLMGTLMANDAGAVSASAQTTMILLVFAGQILAGIAGLPLGTACFWREKRKLLLWLFTGLFGSGLLLAAAGLWAFMSNLPA